MVCGVNFLREAWCGQVGVCLRGARLCRDEAEVCADRVLGQQFSPLLFAWSWLHLARGPVLLVLKAKILDTLLKTNSERVY